MKTKTNIFSMVLLAVVMLCAAGCTKDNGENNENGGNNGNSWNDGGDNGGGGNSGGGGNNNGGVELVGTYNGHEYVDLGLPSGTLWATCNVGASTPEGSGSYFAWGETTTKSSYGNNYKYGYEDDNGNYHFTKYNTNPEYGPVDNLTTLQTSDDAATAKWGSGWRIPSNAQWEELYSHTSITLTAQNGVKGFCFTASNGGSIFLPAVGYYTFSELNVYGRTCRYWTNQLSASEPVRAGTFFSVNENYKLSELGRGFGCPVRAVH